MTDSNDIFLSDCVDRKLSHSDDSDGDIKYYDKCCYIRAMVNGSYVYGCIGLDRNETIDIVDTINLIEEGQNLKIYSIDCKASYIKYFASVFMIFFLLF